MTIAKVIYKDEGDWGYIITRTQAQLDHLAVEPEDRVLYDADQEQNYGTLAEAEALAEEHEVELELE